MIIPVTNINSTNTTYLAHSTPFKSAKKLKISTPQQNNMLKNNPLTRTKLFGLTVLNSLALLFDRELVYDENGKLNSIKRYQNKQLVEIKHFYPGTKKVHEIDNYRDGKLVKMTGFAKDGKTIDWISESNESAEVTTFFHPDGKTVKMIQTESNNDMQRNCFDARGCWTKTENYKNEILTSEKLYYSNRTITRFYTEGKLSHETTHFKTTPVKSYIPEGYQLKNPIHSSITEFDQNSNPKFTTINGIKSNGTLFNGELYKMATMEYPDENTIKLTMYKENGNELYTEIINKCTGKSNVTYSKPTIQKKRH